MSKRKLIMACASVIVVVAAGIWFVRRADANAAPSYRFGAVQLGNVESTVTSTGKLNALQSVAVGTQVSGRVTQLYADYNDRVREGDLLARIDPIIQQQQVRNAESNLERVQAALVQAERDYERGAVLYEQQVITETEFQQIEYSLTVARSNLSSSEVSLEQARQNLAYTEIYSPIDGVVVERNVEPGQTVAASMSAPQLYLLASDLRHIEILATVDESDIGLIRNDMPVRFTVQAYPTDTFVGTVRQVRLSSTTQENVVNYTAVISVSNPDGRLLPGMTATVDFISERAENVFLVPNAALRIRPTDEMIAQLADSSMIAIARGGGGGGGGRIGGGGGFGGISEADIAELQAAMREGGADAAGLIAQRMSEFRGQAGAGAGLGAGGQTGRRIVLGDAAARLPGATNAVPAPTQAADVDDRTPFVPGGQAPSVTRPSFAPLWYMKDGKLGVIQVRTGISDGTSTEVTAPDLEAGMEVIVGLNQAQSAGSQATTNPFQQQGGFGGGGGQQIRFQGGTFTVPAGGFGGPGR